MKNLKYMLFATLAAVTLAACSEKVTPENPGNPGKPDQPEQPAPVLKLGSDVVEATAQGGRYTLAFTLEHPVEDGELKFSCNAAWAINFKQEGDEIHFGIRKNETGSDRQTAVEVSYPGIAKPYPVFTIKQAGKDERPAGKTYRIGDCYEEGRIKGIVYKIDKTGEHGMIMSLEEGMAIWSYEMVDLTIDFGPFTMEDGHHNTVSVKSIENWEKKYPSFAWCDRMNLPNVTAWYMPAIWEVGDIYAAYSGSDLDSEDDNISKDSVEDTRTWFNKCITDAGGTPLSDDYYWSSTQYGAFYTYTFNFRIGDIETDREQNQKDLEHRLRAVRAF